MAQQQYEANHQPGVRPVAAIRDDPIHVVHARNPQLPLQVPNQPIERRQELPSHLDQDVDKWTEFRKFVIRGLKGKTNSKTYITLVLGSMIRSVTFEYIEKALWVSWGLDTGDGCDSKKLLYVFAQVLMKGEPLSMHVGVRGELGATGKELWDMFFALLSGDDLEYGYDVETKIKIECYGQNNRIGWNADEEEEVKNECNESKYVKKMKKLKNLGVKFGMDPRKVIKSTTLNEFVRLQNGGVIPSILSRLQQAEDADDVLIVSNRLQFIQDEIEAYNQRTDDVIEFDPFFTESFVYDTILNHYINEYR
eukprot:163606_1